MIKQLALGPMDNLCYIVEDKGEAIIIDPAWEPENILKEVERLKVVGLVLTHSHHDHTNALKSVKKKTRTKVYSHERNPYAEVRLKDEDKIRVGGLVVEVISTPGHTSDSICLLAGNNLFTGDTVFVQGFGRTDLRGSEEDLIRSLKKLIKLPDNTVVHPGHDYGGKKTTIGEIKNHIKIKDS